MLKFLTRWALLILLFAVTACGDNATPVSPATSPATATPGLTPMVLPSITTAVATMTSALPEVESVLGPLPATCAVSRLNPVEVSKRFAPIAGGPALRFTGSSSTITFAAGQLAQQYTEKYGWAIKVLWVVDPNQKEPITLTWRNRADATPAWFRLTNAGVSMSKDEGRYVTAPVFEPNSSADYVDVPSNVFFPKAGCYDLEARWASGGWKLTFAVGRAVE